MPLMRRLRPNVPGFVTLTLTAVLSACAADPVSTPGSEVVAENTADFSPLSLSQAQSEMSQSGVRIGVRLKSGNAPLIAAELFIDPPVLRLEPEEVEANITAVEETEGGGVLTTDFGGVQITFDGNTGFAREDADAALTADQFLTALRAALAAGGKPHVMARRAAPDSPQAPDNGLFIADRLRIGGNSDTRRIDLNVGSGSLQLNNTPPPDAFLKLLGVSIEIRLSDGTTRLGHRREPMGGRVPFDGLVKSVSLEQQSFMLSTGTLIRMTDRTVIAPDSRFRTLADVAAAIRGGHVVKAAGVGTVASRDPRILTAVAVRFDSRSVVVEFRDGVKAADVEGSKLTLSSGVVLCLNDQTAIDPAGDLKTLAEVARALEAGKQVGAAGTVSPAPDAAGCRAIILKVRFFLRVPPPPPAFEFHDFVKSVDAAGKKFTLASGATLCLNERSVIGSEGPLNALEDVAEALARGESVFAVGLAAPENSTTNTENSITNCRAIVLKVQFRLVEKQEISFQEQVKSVDVEGNSFTLANGVTLCLNEDSKIDQEGDFKTLAEVAEALAGNRAVRAEGKITPGPTMNCRGIVVEVRFRLHS